METDMTTLAIHELSQKVDRLSFQVAFLAEEARQQQRRRQEWDELKADLTPIASDVFRLSVEQLEEVEQNVQIEDILRLFKRLLRNTRTLEQMLDQVESLAELGRDAGPLTRDGLMTLMARLDELERKGYFQFLRGGLEIVDRVVTSFSAEDVRQLGDNIVLILETVKQMTQPDLMRLVRRTAYVVQEEELNGDVSLLAILRQMNDPAVRRGLVKMLTVLKTVSEQPAVPVN